MILGTCLMAVAVVVSCNKPNDNPKPDDPTKPVDKPDDPTKPDEPAAFSMDVSIDGDFSEWDTLTEETADGEYYLYDENTNADRPGILRLKLASDEDYIYVYTELLYDNIYLAEGGPFKQGGSWTGFLDNHPGTPGALIVYVDGDNKSDGAFAARAIGNEESMWDYTGFDAFPQLYFCWDVAANKMQFGWQQNNWPQNHDAWGEDQWGTPLSDHGLGWWGDDTDGTPVSDNTVCDENTCKFSGIVKVKDPVSKADVSVIKMEFAMDREAINEDGAKVNTQTVIGIFYEQVGDAAAQTSADGAGKLPSGNKALTLKLK